MRSLKKITTYINKYNKIYLFPYNIQSKFIAKKNNYPKKIYFADNYAKINKKLIRPRKIIDKKTNAIIITDEQHIKNLTIKLKNINKIILNIKDPNEVKKKINLDKLKINEKSLSELFKLFNTDKGKYYKRFDILEKTHNYGKFYSKIFSKYKKKKINILEIGTYKGASTAAFYFFFKKANFYSVDIIKNFYQSNRIKFIKLNYLDKKKVNEFRNKYKEFFDIIIDDGGHYKTHIIKNIKNFFKCLKINQPTYYVIEDFNLKLDYLNDSKNELKIYDILKKFRKKNYFNSKILSLKEQFLISQSIKKIKVYKGDYIKNGKNISDIAFIKIKKNINC